MTSYLLSQHSGPMPFTGSEICDELGIPPMDTNEFAFLIDGMIAVEVINSAPPVRHTVWWISTGPRFEQESMRGACHPDNVGTPFQYDGREFVEVTYEPRDWAVAIIRKRVIQNCRNNEDVNLWRAISDADDRKRAGARVNLREQLQASLAEAI